GPLERDRRSPSIAGQLVDDELAVRRVFLERDDVQLGAQAADLLELGDGDAVDLDRVVVAGNGVGRESGQSGCHLLLTSLESGVIRGARRPPRTGRSGTPRTRPA